MSTNISGEKRADLLSEINQIKAFIEQNANDENASRLISYLGDLSREVNGKKYGLVFEEHREKIDETLEDNAPVFLEEKDLFIDGGGELNFLLEGDNLASLTLLKKTHRGKIDLIYIDPPYNTGATNWMYNNDYVDSNDSYRHSKWLSMMSTRLTIAKKLLTDKGVLICAIDENEVATLKLLLESIFGLNYEFVCVTIVHNPRGIQGKNFSYTHEFAFFVIPKGDKIIGGRKIPDSEIDWRNLRDNGGESLRSDAKNCFYPIITDGNSIIGFGDVVSDDTVHPNQMERKDKYYYIYPIDIQGIERKWRYARQSVEQIQKYLRIKKTRDRFEIELGKPYGTYRTVWIDARYDANEYGKKLINDLVPNCSFDFPKSLWNVYDCLYAVIAESKNSTVLDFFAGSGTTGHAVIKLNAEDGGHRKFILCTNNENNICRDITYERIKTVITGKRKDGSKYSDGLPGSLKYFKTDFIPITEKMYYEYADELLLHVRELVELENAVNFDKDNSVAIVLDDEEMEAFIDKLVSTGSTTTKTLYIGHDVLLSSKQERILKAHNIKVNVIPDYYYRDLAL